MPLSSTPTKKTRSTKQRAAIKKVFDVVKRPLSPKEILDISVHDVPNLGIATVYRNIKIMVDKKELIAIDIPGQPPRYYLPMANKHPIFICQKTNRAFFIDPHCVKVQIDNLSSHFAVQASETIVYGVYHD